MPESMFDWSAIIVVAVVLTMIWRSSSPRRLPPREETTPLEEPEGGPVSGPRILESEIAKRARLAREAREATEERELGIKPFPKGDEKLPFERAEE